MTWLSRRASGTSSGPDPPASLIEQLRAEFPEASQANVAAALERAHAVASALEGSADVGRDRLAALARERLEIIRIRSAAASGRAGRHRPPDATAGMARHRLSGAASCVRVRPGDGRVEGSRTEGVRRFDQLLGLVPGQAGGGPVDADCLCRTAAHRLEVSAVAVSVPGGLVTPQTVGAAGPLARRMEELQAVLGEGPSLDALRYGTTVLVDDLAAPEQQARWPVFAPAASDAGVVSIGVLPMRLGAARFGVFVLYRDRAGELGREAWAEARTFAGIALDLLLDCTELSTFGCERDHGPAAARQVFDDRPEIHQATGMISAQLDVDLGTALLRMRARAFAEGRLLSEIAADVVARRLRLPDDRTDDNEPHGREAP